MTTSHRHLTRVEKTHDEFQAQKAEARVLLNTLLGDHLSYNRRHELLEHYFAAVRRIEVTLGTNAPDDVVIQRLITLAACMVDVHHDVVRHLK